MKQKLYIKLLSLFLLLSTSIISSQTFIIDGLLYTVTSGTNVSVQNASSYSLSITGDLTIPSTVTNSSIIYKVTSIGNSGFYNNSGLTSVIIPDSVTTIGENAFYQCGLTSFIFPNSLTTIGDNAFFACGLLTFVNIPNTVTSIGDYAFSNCNSLTSIILPNSLTSIGIGTFWQCARLTSIILPNSLTSIGYSAFEECTALNSIVLPNSLTSIDERAFSRCSKLTSIILPNSLTNIGAEAFFGCVGITSIVIPDSVTSINRDAFAVCIGLKSVILPNSVTSIGVEAFSSCISLTSITIPNSVVSIGDYAFVNTGLKSVNVSWATPLPINSNIFPNHLNTITLNVSSPGVLSDYQIANVWKDFNYSALSTEKYLLNNNLRIYPNPTTDFISVSGLTKAENYSIYNISGVKMSNGSVFNNERINTRSLTNGLYFMKLQGGNIIKFIKE